MPFILDERWATDRPETVGACPRRDQSPGLREEERDLGVEIRVLPVVDVPSVARYPVSGPNQGGAKTLKKDGFEMGTEMDL